MKDKDIKEIFADYSEKPSDEVWDRLSHRLDQEMPVTKRQTSAWKWAAVIAAALVCGAVTFAVIRYKPDNQKDIVENKVEVSVNEEDMSRKTSEGVSEPTDAAVEEVDAVQPKAATSAQTSSEPEVKPQSERAAETESPRTSAEKSPKTNVRQVVLPPNSTLARQLAADPVLKNLSDENVEWSKPVHLMIPNLFTPNDDGVNDLFVIEGIEQYANPQLVVRDKNNRVVYRSDNYKNTWGGESCSDGVYQYEFSFTYNGIDNQATGKVRIFRS